MRPRPDKRAADFLSDQSTRKRKAAACGSPFVGSGSALPTRVIVFPNLLQHLAEFLAIGAVWV